MFVDPCNFRTLLKWICIQDKNYASLAAMQRKRSYFVKNDSSRSPGLACSYGNISIPVTESRLLIYTRQNVYERKSSVDRTHMTDRQTDMFLFGVLYKVSTLTTIPNS